MIADEKEKQELFQLKVVCLFSLSELCFDVRSRNFDCEACEFVSCPVVRLSFERRVPCFSFEGTASTYPIKIKRQSRTISPFVVTLIVARQVFAG